MIIDNLPTIPSTVTTGDELAVERGTTTYKVDYNALESVILDKVLRQPSTPVVFGGSEDAFSANIVTLLDSMTPGESRTISTYIDVGTDNFDLSYTYYGTLYKIHDQYAAGILTDNARSLVLIGRSGSNTVYFKALAKEAVVPVGVGGTGATTQAGACTNIGAVKKSGDTMTGTLIVDASASGDPRYQLHGANGRKWTVYRNDSTDLIFAQWGDGLSWRTPFWMEWETGKVRMASPLDVSQGGTGAINPAGARANIGSGCPSGTFTTADGKTVTVTNGFITAIT